MLVHFYNWENSQNVSKNAKNLKKKFLARFARQKCAKYVKIPEICNFHQKGRICHINIFTYFSWVYMTSVRYRGQIMICGFDLMISLAHYYSRSGIWNLHKVSPRLEWIHYSGHVSFIITTGLTWPMTALPVSLIFQ